MPYTPITTSADIGRRLVIGQTREDHYLEFKGVDEKGRPWTRNEECARDVAQFANASGGTIVVGAVEQDHLLAGFQEVTTRDSLASWIDSVLNERLEPVPPVVAQPIDLSEKQRLLAVNVPPSLSVVAHKIGKAFEFVTRAENSKRYMTLMEVEARMGSRERVAKLLLQQIGPAAAVTLDAHIPAGGVDARNWRVEGVDDHAVTLAKEGRRFDVPLGYVEAVHRTNEQGASWIIAMDCHVQEIEAAVRVRKFRP